METLTQPWMEWVILAVLAAIFEMTIPYFTFSFVSAGAAAAALVSLKFGGLTQAIVFALFVTVSVFFLRPLLLRRFHVRNSLVSRSEELVGTFGEVTEPIDPVKGLGRVMVSGQDWAARSDLALISGQRIQVIGHDGIVLIVKGV